MNNYKNRTESEIRILSPEQYIAVCEASYKHPLGFLIRILMYTGITVVELLVLSWRDINIHRNRLHIPQLYVSTDHGSVKHPQVQSRCIPLLPFLRKELVEWEYIQKSHCAPFEIENESGPAFVTALDGNPLYPDDVEHIFHEILDMCGIAPLPISVLRDSFGIYVLASGISPYSFNEIMGDPNASDFYGDFLKSLINSASPVNRLMSGRW